jgi:hypothetical protein
MRLLRLLLLVLLPLLSMYPCCFHHLCCCCCHCCCRQKYTNEEAVLRLLKGGKEVTVAVCLAAPVRLIPFHIKGLPPSYFIVAGLVFTPATVPYLRSEYGKEYDFDAPVSKVHSVNFTEVSICLLSSTSCDDHL